MIESTGQAWIGTALSMGLLSTRRLRACREFVAQHTAPLPAQRKSSIPSRNSSGSPFTLSISVLPINSSLKIYYRLTGGKSESYANLAEGMATTLVCFDDLEERRDQGTLTQKHCILICNSVPYSMPVQECYMYENKTVDQLASIFQEKEINFSILSPRKIPVLFKLFEKSGGDLSSSTSKNYCKDPRHLVLLKGYSLKERPASPPATATINLPSPLASNMIPMSNQMEAAGNQMLAAPNITQSGPMRSNMNNTARKNLFALFQGLSEVYVNYIRMIRAYSNGGNLNESFGKSPFADCV